MLRCPLDLFLEFQILRQHKNVFLSTDSTPVPRPCPLLPSKCLPLPWVPLLQLTCSLPFSLNQLYVLRDPASFEGVSTCKNQF